MAPGPIHLPSRRQALQWVDATNLVVALPIWLLLALQVRVLSMVSFNLSAFAIVVTLMLRYFLDRTQQLVIGHEPFVASMSHELRTPLTTIGLGLHKGEHELIFDRFYRGSNVRGQGGRGLGLGLVKSLMTAMGGRVSAAPRLDGSPGTEFLVPLRACPAPS